MQDDEQFKRKVQATKEELEITKTLATEAFQKVMARGDALESLVDKTQHLKSESVRFKRSASRLNDDGCCSCFTSFWRSTTEYFEDLSLPNNSEKDSGYGSINHSVSK